ncbi:hypothetical protein D6C86_09429 [Aureobasidium pullulans]|uniref:Uncharacterized protein n=1 Tax=Aureobasidium pullulans TaxID=5580 RepID=A0A4S9PVK9_AURPU|nr:hypothetical protein D6C94_05233 [Aureobasidium pullulans]THZ39834.1 hypothetical protein D6C87_06849 [Aureobasidium pullulans]THZ54476.1 hypothetical protein D6C86_09429 [Aureobasidium pullulans]THZ54738.1 hypothetical protein D6C88_09505 [Aureobasidium pullulans]
MPRTKVQAIQQAGAPPSWETQTLVRALDDHSSSPVKIAWSRTNGDSSPFPPFPVHVYLIRGVDSLAADEVLADQLLYCLHKQQLADPCWHLELFTAVRDNIFACVEHYQQEKISRRLGSQAPYVPDKNCFLVIDSDKWKEEGLLSVRYTKENASLPYNVMAERYKNWDHLATRLRDEWSDQGMISIEELLDGENLARGWPIDLNLYPESGPDQSVNGMTLAAFEQSPSSALQSADEALDFESISVHVNGAVAEQCQDSDGFPYTALRYDSSQTPRFVFYLFVLSRDISTEDSLKVFTRLNTGLLADVSWTLHLYSNATMSSAYSIFAQAMSPIGRTDTSTQVPSSYARPSLQIYHDVYMCLDASKPQPDGPCFTLSRPGPNPSPRSDYDPNDLDHIPTHPDKYAGEPDRLDLYTFNPGSWELASDMLHTYFALSSHTQAVTRSLPSSSSTSPSISLRISVNSELSSDASIPSPIELFITSRAPAPLTLNVKGTIFDTSDWYSYLRIVQAGSSAELSIKPANEESNRVFSLGERLLDYGFTKRVANTGDDRPPHLITLYPNVPVQLPVQRPLPASFLANLRPDENEYDKRFLDDHKAEGQALFNTSNIFQNSLHERYQGSWEVGKRYAFELRDNATVPRWTWGTVEQLQGPYGLPALAIGMEEGENREFVLVD